MITKRLSLKQNLQKLFLFSYLLFVVPCYVLANGNAQITQSENDEIGLYSATLNCNVNDSFDSEQETKIGVVYTNSGTPSKSNGTIVYIANDDIDDEGNFVVELTNLAPSTTYKYRTFVIKGGLYFYGLIQEFTTLTQQILLSAGNASNLTCFSAKIKGSTLTLAPNFEYNSISYGVCYSENTEPTIKDNKIQFANIMSANSYDIQLKALKGDTKYYYRAYTIIDGHENYSEVKEFCTKTDDVVKTLDCQRINNDYYCSAELTLSGGAFSKIVLGICSWKYDKPTVNNNKVTTDELDEENKYSLKLTKTVPGHNYYRAYVLIDGVPHYGEVKRMYKEPQYVDLGLSVKWADCNIGAISPEDYGEYYRWGETEESTGGPLEEYKFYEYKIGDKYKYSKYVTHEHNGDVVDGLSVLQPEDDAACVKWGNGWRMPTYNEVKELREKCTITYKIQNDTHGCEITGPNGNSIFFPFAGMYGNVHNLSQAGDEGCYWTSNVCTGDYSPNIHAWYLQLRYNCDGESHLWRDLAMTIRPVCDYNDYEEDDGTILISDNISSFTNKGLKDCSEINYTRTFNNTNWQALYVPFSMSYNDWKDDFDVARINAFYEYDNDNDGVVDKRVLEILPVVDGNGYLIPNTPYMIKAKSKGEKTLKVKNTYLYVTDAKSYECSSMETKYTFTGTYEKMAGLMSNGYYFMSGGSLKTAPSDATTLGAFRWYMKPESKGSMLISPSAEVKIRVVGEEEDATDIIMPMTNAPSSIFTIDGRQINSHTLDGLKPGIYIVNGKKLHKK